MNLLRHTDAGYTTQLRVLAGTSSLFDPTIEKRTREIIDAIRSRGDESLLEYTERFDGVVLTADQLP